MNMENLPGWLRECERELDATQDDCDKELAWFAEYARDLLELAKKLREGK